ncbi:diacylglycerol/lipid kinase family protein [Roseibacillus ishigakijimensis]|uniref:DAGKc domain-containing protein n=1 Tax=Roseibacillus ishigakijimensis TaxID=454146 RepID=A0A934VM33_9BACT|nr:diacylglycerol kinase family protein [Roseibacillus ishigakijimensis]MBK1833852.1 hypothetical protein [Roseibacillus ishigakijimensis]
MHPIIVINTSSGSGEFAERSKQEEILALFRHHHSGAELRAVGPESFQQTIQEALAGPYDTIIVGGGDGSLTSTAQLVAEADKTLGVIPLGTFNLEARDLGVSLDPMEAAAQLATAGRERIDYLMVNDHICLCALILGFYPALAEMREEYHGKAWWQKSLRTFYETSVLATETPALHLQLQTPQGLIERESRMTAISPGPYAEEFGLIPKRDQLSSGLIHAYVSSHLSRKELLAASLHFISGQLSTTENLEMVTATEMTIATPGSDELPLMIDGEILTLRTPLDIQLRPQALSVLRP